MGVISPPKDQVFPARSVRAPTPAKVRRVSSEGRFRSEICLFRLSQAMIKMQTQFRNEEDLLKILTLLCSSARSIPLHSNPGILFEKMPMVCPQEKQRKYSAMVIESFCEAE